MQLRAETQNLLQEIEHSSDRTLNHRDEVGLLIEIALQHRLMEAFNEAIFLAKFVTKSMTVMKRIGDGGEGYDKLSAEFQFNVQKTSALLKQIAAKAPEDSRRNISHFFFSLTPEGLEHLMLLLSDLAIVKNWVLDGHKLPGETGK
jgi:hypothetical protein